MNRRTESHPAIALATPARYTLLGALAGLGLPLFATALELLHRALPPSGTAALVGAVVAAHRLNPLLPLIDSAPVGLGFVAWLVGIRQQRIDELNASLSAQIGETTAALARLEADGLDRERLEARLTHLAFHDPLTNLANRALFRDRVERAVARAERRGSHVAVLFADLDDFKTVNDSLGHAAGDQLLVVVAERLAGAVRRGDTVARLGGDEFAVLLEDVDGLRGAAAVAEHINATLRAPIRLDENELVLGITIGLAHSSGREVGADVLLSNADVAMYRAKARGKNCFEIFQPEMQAEILEQMELDADLIHALERNEFRVVYQPIVNLDTGAIAGMEALVRWEHPRRGRLAPASFIHHAEATGLIVPLGMWVLREATRNASAWQSPSAPPLSLTVNLSARQLQHPTLIADVAAALRDSGLAPERLVLEITETVLVEHSERVLERLHELKGLGVRLAIDDFGTGYSSLSYLQRFPVDILKIDKAFVDGIGESASDAALARTIIALGNMLELRVVAEGVEETKQWHQLRALGCDFGQGYLFARPVSEAEMDRLVRMPALLPAAATAPAGSAALVATTA